MLIALTGATGFLGSHLMARFLASGADVVALVRDDGPGGRHRLRRALDATDSPPPAGWQRRVRLLAVDLTRPGLGLGTADRRELAAAVDEWWHSAGLIDLVADPGALRRVNVDGTRHFLEFLHAGGARGRVVHISTVYVAGGRLEGLVKESDLDGRYGFLTPYERSKYQAEQLVRAWARRHGRPVTVLRPAVLVTSRCRPPTAPRHPLAEIGARLSLLTRGRASWSPIAAAGPLRFPGRPDATVNLLPVEYAGEVMGRLLGRTPLTYTDTFHLTHPHETPVQAVLDATEQLWPGLSVRLDPACTRLGPAQRALADITRGITAYCWTRRRYDRALLDRALAPAVPLPPEVDPAYLRRALLPPVHSSRRKVTRSSEGPS
ncbi:NAD-dependent epimerase/dehydratase family protein [Streptomyces albofaciens JCM 4342]|uniref:SDR family oxidoreductase n=1 Tax=Streptomyces albofaciens TaxID=66866 RepID=UPI001238A69B|nr:SDR family oxidoreductase [Streptomyces albofaciens]KAA6223524.1 NAD-dependent epimerase/dehydratase family protein [Streptomyces albofaciens JCM 4342]